MTNFHHNLPADPRGLPADPRGLPADEAGADTAATPFAFDRDLLISRIIDARAGDAEWDSLRTIAARDSAIWDDLAAARRDATDLTAALLPALAAADRTAMPRIVTHRAGGLGFSLRRHLGWAVAAALALVAALQFSDGQTTGIGNASPAAAGLPGVTTRTPEQALADYLDIGRQAGRVVGEMPERLVIESRPNPAGPGYEVLYIRQLIERAVVSDVFRIGVNEAGKKIYVPSSVPVVPSSVE